jgi:tripartite-type tricarboxylate transporter receptor subunit TctC
LRPRDTPAEIIEKLNREINAAVTDPKIRMLLDDLDVTVFAGAAADFASFIASETTKWAKVVKFSGARPD